MMYSVGIIPTSVGAIPASVGIVPTCVRIIPTLVETCRNYSCTAKSCLTLCAMCRNFSYKLQQCRNISYKILQKFSIKLNTCRNHAFYTSVKFLPALHLEIMISYLVWNMLYESCTIIDAEDTDVYIQAATISHHIPGVLCIKKKKQLFFCRSMYTEDIANCLIPFSCIDWL